MKEIYAGVAEEELAMDKFWRRKDLLLLVPGSLPCLRGVYSRALSVGKCHQVSYVRMTNSDYVLGTAEERIRNGIRRAALRKGVKIIIVYLSCLEILIRIDFEDIERQMAVETKRIVPFPWGLFSGRMMLTEESGVLGIQMEKLLKHCLAVMDRNREEKKT